jgi:hypothetical protein
VFDIRGLKEKLMEHVAYELFHEGRFVLIHLAQDVNVSNEPRNTAFSHIKYVDAVAEDVPVEWRDVHTVLVRPDGYIAWAVSMEQTGVLRVIGDGITRWCGGEQILL